MLRQIVRATTRTTEDDDGDDDGDDDDDSLERRTVFSDFALSDSLSSAVLHSHLVELQLQTDAPALHAPIGRQACVHRDVEQRQHRWRRINSSRTGVHGQPVRNASREIVRCVSSLSKAVRELHEFRRDNDLNNTD